MRLLLADDHALFRTPAIGSYPTENLGDSLPSPLVPLPWHSWWWCPRGTLLLKVFMGAEHKKFLAELRTAFTTVKTTRPEATRKGSAETYVFATGLKHP